MPGWVKPVLWIVGVLSGIIILFWGIYLVFNGFEQKQQTDFLLLQNEIDSQQNANRGVGGILGILGL